MYLSRQDIDNTPRVKKLNIINSISGIKPGNLIGTKSNNGKDNLAIISSVVHLGSNPPYLGFIVRPSGEVRRDTYENILENGCFTINHIHTANIENAHYTSAKFPQEISEFDACSLTPEFKKEFIAPFVKESPIQIGLKHVESVHIKSTDTTMIVGEVQHLFIQDGIMDERGYLDLGQAEVAGVSGLNCYYELNKIGEFPYARVEEVPYNQK